jgi:uncharacterized damage-inducible protein DinB
MSHSAAEDRDVVAFASIDMKSARFNGVDLTGATFRECAFRDVVMNGVEMLNTTISGEIENLVINGVDVAPLVEAELDRLEPDRIAFRPTQPDGFRAAWELNESLWAATVRRAEALPVAALNRSVDGEWSFLQTLRHLAFATESWVGRAVLGQPSPWDPLSLPCDGFDDISGLPNDPSARPSFNDVLVLRRRAMDLMRRVLSTLTEEELDRQTDPQVLPGWPREGDTFAVRKCLLIVLNEEWWHRKFAERDLAVLEAEL